jgi:hypothetical protein
LRNYGHGKKTWHYYKNERNFTSTYPAQAQIFWWLQIVVNEDGIHSLLIMSVTRHDSGVYTCIARNKAGEDTFSVTLTVLGTLLCLILLHRLVTLLLHQFLFSSVL